MPRSKVRRKTVYTPEKHAPKAQGRIPSRLIPILMCAFLLLGLAWIVVWYINGPNMPGMSALGPWNLVIGFALMGTGFIFATRWR